MNILLWVLQGLLAIWNIIGGSYTFMNYEQLKGEWAANLPKPVWLMIAVLQIIFAVGILIPKTTPISATYLALNSLLGCVLFAQYAGFPGLLWGVIPGAIAAFIAYSRWT